MFEIYQDPKKAIMDAKAIIAIIELRGLVNKPVSLFQALQIVNQISQVEGKEKFIFYGAKKNERVFRGWCLCGV